MRSRLELDALRVVREHLARWRPGEVSDVDVSLVGAQDDTRLVVTFSDRDRPGCTFGMRFHIEDLVTPADPEPSPTVVSANLDERIDRDRLPKDCRPGEVTWLSGLS
jgi:hypothetical protein